MANWTSMPQRQLVSQLDAAQIQSSSVPRSKFHNNWTRKTTFNARHLVPFFWDEIYPGDHMTYDVTAFVRMATPLFPLFDNMRVDTFFFFVPNRILWDNWEKFMGAQDNPADSVAFTTPKMTMTVGGEPAGSLADHLGLPGIGQIAVGTGVLAPIAFPFRAYNKIYNDWFRDQNLTNSLYTNTGNGPDNIANYDLAARAKPHDYFTSALPWPQKGTAASVSSTLSGNLPIRGIGFWANSTTGELGALGAAETGGVTTNYATHRGMYQNTPGAQIGYVAIRTAAGYPSVYADLSSGSASGITINAIRQAWMIQQLLEHDARGGTRYVEKIREHFRVISPDFRLQRAEYIGGGQTPLAITPIAQTAPNSDDTGLGSLGGAGTAAGRHHASYAATEHGIIIGLINVRSELSYQQGLHRTWFRDTMVDYYFPSTAGLGEQAIYQMELYAQGTAADLTIFGYQERWQELRTRYSDVSGRFRSTAPNAIDQWHLAQEFSSAPLLNDTFVKDLPPMERVLAAGITATQQGVEFLADINIRRTAVRPIPVTGVPASLGRF